MIEYVDWLLDGNSFDGERPHVLGCHCGACNRPRFDPKINSVINLYQRCRQRRSLPYAGSLLEQPEELMEMFDVIDARVAEHQKQKNYLIEREAKIRQMEAELRNG